MFWNNCLTEHPAVLDPCRHLEARGYKVTYLPVDSCGLVDPDDLERAIIAEIGRVAKEHGVLFHTDAAQAVGHIPTDVEAMEINLLSLSAHKIYGPKGVGALYVRKRQPRVRLTEQMRGGGHERDMRSGTLNVPGIVGLGTALDIARREMTAESKRLRGLREDFGKSFERAFLTCNSTVTQRDACPTT